MEENSNSHLDHDNPEIEVSGKFLVLFSAFLILVFLLVGSFLGIVSTEISCNRSLSYTECILVRKTSTFQMTPIKIIDPVLVDIVDYSRKNRGRYGGYSGLYTAKIRVKNASYMIDLISSYNYDELQSSAHKINNFLLSSNDSTFSMKIP